MQGDTIWTRTFNNKNSNSGFSAVQTMDGGYLIASITSTYGVSNTKDGFIIKLNELGDTVWTKTIDKGMDDWVSCIVELSGGDFVVSGRTNSLGYGGYDTFLARYDSNGNEIWFKNYGGTADDSGGKIIVSNDSGIVFSGTTYSFGHGAGDLYLIKTNINGDTLWTKTYGGSNDDMGGGSIYQTNDNGFITGGITNSYGNGVEMYLVKTRADGFAGIENNELPEMEIDIYPNPCTDYITLESEIFSNGNVRVDIENAEGVRMLSKHVHENCSAKLSIDVSFLPQGIYFLYVSTNETRTCHKIIIN